MAGPTTKAGGTLTRDGALMLPLEPPKSRNSRKALLNTRGISYYSSPAQPLGPEDLTWRMIAGKLVNIKLHTRRSQRVVKGSRIVCRCDCWRPNSTATNPLSPILS